MPSAERSVTIQRPVNTVFTFVADGLTGPQWRSGVLDVAHVSGEGVGAIAGPVRPTGAYGFNAVEGGTRMTFSLDAQLSGLQKLLGGAVQKTMDAEVAALDKLKALLESR